MPSKTFISLAVRRRTINRLKKSIEPYTSETWQEEERRGSTRARCRAAVSEASQSVSTVRRDEAVEEEQKSFSTLNGENETCSPPSFSSFSPSLQLSLGITKTWKTKREKSARPPRRGPGHGRTDQQLVAGKDERSGGEEERFFILLSFLRSPPTHTHTKECSTFAALSSSFFLLPFLSFLFPATKQNYLWAFLAYGPVLMLTVLVHELGHCFASRSVGAAVHGERKSLIFFF